MLAEPNATRDPEPAPRLAAIAAGLALLALFLAWLPYLTRLDVVVRHFDAPNYLVVAKTLYRATAANPMPGYALAPKYFAVHLPLYPLVVRALSPFGGYETGLLLATALLGIGSAVAFAFYVREVEPAVAPALSLLAFLFIPARHFLYRALGATEALMALLVVLALLAYRRERFGWAFAAAGLAAVTRINGLLLVGVLALVLLSRRRFRAAFVGGACAVVPLLLVLGWHGSVFGDPLAFLHVHDQKLTPVPFGFIGALAASNDWETAEMLLALFLFYVLAAARLFIQGHRAEAGLVAAHVALFAFMRERDLARYFLTVAPFAVVLAWREVWTSRWASIAVLAVLGPLAVVYAWQTIPMNLASPEAFRALRALLHS